MAFSSDPAGVSNQVERTVNLPDFKNPELFKDRLEDLMQKNANTINSKTGGLYNLAEILSFQQVYKTNDPQNFRSGYRKVFDLVNLNGGNIAAGATVNFPHGISNLGDPIMIYASCRTTAGKRFTVVYNNVFLDNVNISFTNPEAVALQSSMAVCEYLKF